ncbi:MAG: DUF2127 domain-containing protein [Patescibacteria group bacterium]|nr:DUF2127 domain-containing protein [Patescibacteria group bacterium]
MPNQGPDLKNERREEEIHEVFDVTLFLKGIHAALETLGGILLYAVSGENIMRMIGFFVGSELQEDPHDFIANWLLRAAESFGGSAQSFAAFYLLFHGIINGAIVIALWKEKLWAYPASMAALAGFIAYQSYLFYFNHSVWYAIFTVLDVLIILLVWHEYGVLKKKKKN